MTENFERSINELHERLASIYRKYPRGLSYAAYEETEGIWARIEKLENDRVRATVRRLREAMD